MAAIPLSEEAVARVRQALERRLPKVGAAHLGEALARALGHRTDAALRATLQAERDDPPITLLDAGQFRARLQELGYPPPRLRFEHLHEAGLIATESPGPRPRRYSSTRARAWRNLMVCAINAGLAQKLFSLRADDNRWPLDPETDGCLFDFTLPNGWPARGNVRDIGYAELSVRAAVHPNGDWIRATGAGFLAGEAVAEGWLERQTGAWLQASLSVFACRRHLTGELAALQVEPQGYGDGGRVML